MPSVTPFELSLERELNVERQRFDNQWLFKWHGMTYAGGVTDVEDFRGGRIYYGGIKFGYQQQQVFWQALERYLLLQIHEAFKKWDAETTRYSLETRLRSIDGVSQKLRIFVRQLNVRAVETDRRLRGQGYSGSVKLFDSVVQMSRAEAEILRVAEANRHILVEEIDKAKVALGLAVRLPTTE